MPKLLYARPPRDVDEERRIRKLAGSRHTPGDWICRAQMIARELSGHPQTVRERLLCFNAEGLGDRPGSGRKRRLTEAERSTLVALARSTSAGRPV